MEKIESDEIDLYSLLVSLIHLLKRHIRLFSLLGIVGVALGGIYYTQAPKIFSGKMIVHSDILTEPYANNISENLTNLINQESFDTLAVKLDLSSADAAQLRLIKMEGQQHPHDSIFTITAEVRDKQMMPRLQNGILGFLRNNEFLKTRVAQRKELYLSLIARIRKEIKQLDSLKHNLFQNKTAVKNNSNIILFDPSLLFSKTVEVHKLQVEYESKLRFADGVQLVAGFTTYEKSGPGLWGMLLLGFVGGVFFAFLWLAVLWIIRIAKT